MKQPICNRPEADNGPRRHRIIHRKAPSEWQNGFPLGNGVLGVMAWGSGRPLAFSLDHAELWDLRINRDFMDHPDFNYKGLCRLVSEGRFDEAQEIFELREGRDNPVGPTKISIGRAELALGAAEEYECGLDIDRAMIEGAIRTAGGNHQILGFVHRSRNVFCLKIGDCPRDAEMKMVPLSETSAPLAKLNHPAPQLSREGDVRIFLQEIPGGPFYAVIWNVSGPEFYLAVETAKSGPEAVRRAKETRDLAIREGFDRLFREHLELWQKFWAVSAIYLPEAEPELIWYYANYLLASCARRGYPPPGLQGLWAMDGVLPPWRGDYHADVNIQETFWPACASGHLDLLDTWCDHMKACMPQAREFTRQFFGSEGTFWPATSLPEYVSVPCWYTTEYAWSPVGWLGWLVWLRWRYSCDRAWLAETGYPLIAEIFKFYRDNLREEADGRLHIPLSSSPEYQGNLPAAWCKDPNSDIAMIRRCCDWVVEMEEALGVADLTGQARKVKGKLTPYALTEKKELCLWPGKPLDVPHRHPSHLMAIHPAMDLTMEGDEEARRIINASVDQYFLLGRYAWAGHTFAQLISFAAVLGRSGWAYDSLRLLIEHWLAPNGLHVNRDLRDSGVSEYSKAICGKNPPPFTMEANCAAGAGISDMLVQGWGDIIRIFPAVSEYWGDVAFRDLLAEGAFRVSAVRRKGRTVWVRVTAGTKRKMRLRDPFGGAAITVSGGRIAREQDCFVADLEPGQSLTFTVEGETEGLEHLPAVGPSWAPRLGSR